MSRQGEELQARNDVGQRGLWLQPRDVISVVIELVVAVLILMPFILDLFYSSSEARSAQWLLLYAAVMYAIAVVTTLVRRGAARPRTRQRRSVIGSVLQAFLILPTAAGSFAVVQALSQLVGMHGVDSHVISVLTLMLFGLVYVPLLLLARRTTTRS